MKQFKCKICGLQCSSFAGLGPHLSRTHKVQPADYYNEYLGKPGSCEWCEKPTRFTGLGSGYRQFCNNSCQMHARMNDPEYAEYWKEKKTKENQELWSRPGNEKRRKEAGKRLRTFLLKDHKENREQHLAWAAQGGSAYGKARKANPEAYKDTFSKDELKRRSVEASKRLRDPDNKFGKRFASKKTEYGGFLFKSSWELKLAKFLDKLEYEWEYEDTSFALDGVRQYTPDFYIPQLDLFIEVKPKCFLKKYAKHAQAVKAEGHNFKFLSDMDTDGSWGRARKWLREQKELIK